jgi:thioredoxin-related protein
MKKVVLVVLFIVVSSTMIFAQQKSYDLNWKTDFEEAKAVAQQENKLVLIYFTGSDWSSACKKLNKDFFYTEKFKKLSDENLVLVRVDAPQRPNLISDYQTNSNQGLSKKYNQKVYPTVVIVDANGKKLGMIESYNYLHDTSKHYALINNALKN